MPSIGSTTQRRAAPTGVLPDGTMRLAGKQENGTADARRWIRIRHGLHGGYRSRRSWQASLKRWSLSRPRASPCICGSSFLLSRPLHPAAGEAGLHREQNPMHLYRLRPAHPPFAAGRKPPLPLKGTPKPHPPVRTTASGLLRSPRCSAGPSQRNKTPCTNSARCGEGGASVAALHGGDKAPCTYSGGRPICPG
jgi:hypothetical protein